MQWIWISSLTTLFASASAGWTQCHPGWSSLDGHKGWGTRALAAHDADGRGPAHPAMFVGNGLSDISTIARWDGWAASALGGPHEHFYYIEAMQSVPEPIGEVAPGLYMGGGFSTLSGVPFNSLARWSDGAWHDVADGLTASYLVLVKAMAIFDEDGPGPRPPALFVGGRFEFAGSASVSAIARWDGVAWSDMGGGLGSSVGGTYPKGNAMAVYDDGRGPALYVAGNFDSAGGKECWNIARWDGEQWEAVGPGINGTVDCLHVYDEDGEGPERSTLFAGGQFGEVRGGERNSLMRIGRWDGAEWTPVGGWRNGGGVRALMTWDPDGPGPKRESLYMGGFFTTLPDGSPANRLARWDGEDWHPVGGGVTSSSGFGPTVYSLAVLDEDGPGPNPGGLYVGGIFSHAGGVPAENIARWGCPLPPSPPCYADCDGDGDLAFFDFLCFQNLFAAMDPTADCDQSGDLDFFDFLCFQNAFAAGCE